MELNRRGNSKDRTTNFNKDEVTKLTWLLKDYPIITSKKTDHASNQHKDAAWRSLAAKFYSDAVVYRNIKQLQQKFNNMKKIARKETSAEKSGRRQTGGGPPPPKPSETTEWLNSIMGESISGLPAVYDSDALGDTAMDAQNVTAASVNLDFVEDNKLYEESNTPSLDESTLTQLKIQNSDLCDKVETAEADKCSIVFDTSTPKALLRKPISRELSICYNKKKKSLTPLETRKRIINHFDGKIIFLSQRRAREEEIKKYAEEEHLQNMKEKREMHEKKIAQIEEKHFLYLEQQKEIHALEIEFKKKMHELLLKKGKLEIKQIKT